MRGPSAQEQQSGWAVFLLLGRTIASHCFGGCLNVQLKVMQLYFRLRGVTLIDDFRGR